MNIEQIKDKIETLQEGEELHWPHADYGKAEIRKKNEMYEVWEIPMYGGEPCFYRAFDKVEDVILEVGSWT